MRIVFVLQYYHPYVGGLESLFRHLAEGLVRRGHTVSVITTQLRGTAPLETINGVRVERVKTPHLADRYFFILFSMAAAIRAARQSDLIHSTPYAGAIPAYFSARLSGKPVVFTALEVLGRRWFRVEANVMKAALYDLYEKLVYRLPYDRIAAISQATLEDAVALGIDVRHGRVIYCGVDEQFSRAPGRLTLRVQLGLAAGDFIYLYYGRPGITKGVDVLLRAAPQIHAAVPNAHLVLLLSEEPRLQFEKMQRLAVSLDRDACIHFIASVPRADLTSVLSDANCVVVPSLTEGFGLTTAEACTLGVPVVATHAGSIPEVISGRHILVEPDSSTALAEGVIRISKGEWQETPLKTFSWDSMVDAYEKLYQELLA